MTTRITQKDAEQALRVYCTRAGIPFGHYMTSMAVGQNDDGSYQFVDLSDHDELALLHEGAARRTYVITGGLALSAAYGGYQVQQIIGLDGTDPNRDGRPCTGVRTPFGGGYQSARGIVNMLRGAISALEMQEGR